MRPPFLFNDLAQLLTTSWSLGRTAPPLSIFVVEGLTHFQGLGLFHPFVRRDRVRAACTAPWLGSTSDRMDLNEQIRRYFGTSDLSEVSRDALEAGVEHMKVNLGLTQDSGERFALWALLHTLGSAPDLDVVFKSEAEREAARNFMDLLHGASDA